MEPNHERSIVPRPDFRIEKSAGGENRIVAAMVNETLLVARTESQGLHARFKIGDYEWCEPDYRQILAWAKTLALDPEIVIERLSDDRSIRERAQGFPTWAGTRFEHGKIIALHWDLDHLPLDHFVWVEGLNLSFLSFSAHPCDLDGRGKTVKNLKLPFPNLRCLSCGCLDLQELDLTRVGKLEELDCCRTDIDHLDLSCVPLLKELDCSETPVSELDLSHTPHLTYLNCELTKVSALSLSRSPNLAHLDCGDTEISELDLSGVPSLMALNCMNAKISELDLWCVPNLTLLDCRGTPVSEWAVDLAAVPHLTTFWCSGSNMFRLMLEAVPNLTSLDCDSRMEIDLSYVPKLEYLLWECWTPESNEPLLSAVPVLKELWCNGGCGEGVTQLDLSAVPKLEKLCLQHNRKLVGLDLSAVPNLAELTCLGTR